MNKATLIDETNYSTVLLGDVIQHRKEFITINDLEDYKRCRVQLNAKGVILRDVIKGTEIKTKKQQVCRTDEFLVAEIDAKIGGFGMVPEALNGAVVSSHYFLFKINEKRLDKRFLDFFVRTPIFRDQVSAQGSTNYAAIRPTDVLGYQIPLPPIEEQRRVVAQIEALAEKVGEARGLRSSAIQEIQAFASSLHLHLAESRMIRLSDILELDENKEEVKFGQQYPQVGVRGFGEGLFEREVLDATQTTYRAFNRLYEGAIVLSQVKGWEGALAGCPKSLIGKYVSPEYRTFRCLPNQAVPEYMKIVVSTPWFWTKLKDLTRGMGGRRERIRPEQFLKMEILMPTFDQQQLALEVLRKLEPLKQLQTQTDAGLNALLPSILNKAFKGEL